MKQQFDDDGDAVMSVCPPVFEFIKAPKLTKWNQASLVQWKQERDQYERLVQQRCAESGEQQDKVMMSIKATVEPKLLETICLYQLQKPVDDVTEEELKQLIAQRVVTVMNNTVPDLDQFFRKNLTMDLQEQDIEARVMKYFTDFTTLVAEHGFGSILGIGDPAHEAYNKRMKLRCQLLIDNLEPRMLRDDVKRFVQYVGCEAKKNDFELFNVVKERAQQQHRYHKMSQETKREQKPPTGKPRRDERHEERKPSGRKPDRTPPVKSDSGPAPKTACWHCKGEHWLSVCPTATEADKDAARQRMREVRDGTKAKRVLDPDNEGSETSLTINGLVTTPYCADSGADRNMMPRRVLEDLNGLGDPVSLVRLQRPVTVVVAGGATLTCTEEVTVDINLRTAAGAVHIPNVTCLVMEGMDVDFLLGNETLCALGIDVNRQLEQLAGRTDLDTDDPFEPPEPHDDDTHVLEQLEALVAKAGTEGFDPDYMGRLHDLVMEYKDVFRTNLRDDPPARVEPLRITLKEGTVPFRAKARRYTPAQREFLLKYTQELVSLGNIKRNDLSRWACAAVPVAKPGRPNEFRLTIDYRPVNAMTVPIAGSPADPNDDSQCARGSYGFGEYDLLKGFWQMPLEDESQEPLSFVTDHAVFTPLRVAQGTMDSPQHFQNQMQSVFQDMMYKKVLIYIDDILVFGQSPEDFLATTRAFFKRLREYRLKLSVAKSSLFSKTAKWCSRIVSGQGIAPDPARLSALGSLPLPPTAADLQHFMCATGWLRDSLMDYGRVTSVLHDKLESALAGTGRTKRLAAGIHLTWTPAESAAYDQAKQLLHKAQLLHFPDDTATVCVFTDASDLGWGIVVTQVDQWDRQRSVVEQDHAPLICKSGRFTPTEQRWSVIEKEAFPIIWASKNLSYLLYRRGGVQFYCDHKNLLFVFAPAVEVKRHVRGKLQRWAMSLTGLVYTIEHIDGTANVWADLLRRWGLPHNKGKGVMVKCKYATRSARQPFGVQLRPLANRFVFPTRDQIKAAQATHHRHVPHGCTHAADGLVEKCGKPWVPEEDKGLVQRIMVVAHCGAQGHRGLDPMVTTIKDAVYISNLDQRCRQFLSRCLLCKHTKGGNIIPRPWGPTYNASERNQVLHWDFLVLGEGLSNNSPSAELIADFPR